MNRSRAFTTLAVLMGLDVATTLIGLGVGRSEGNPFAAALLGLGPDWLVLVVAKAAALGAIYALQKPLSSGMASGALMGCCAVMLGVVSWNVAVIL